VDVFSVIFFLVVCIFGFLSPLIALGVPNFRWWSIWLIAEFVGLGSIYIMMLRENGGGQSAFGIATLVVLFVAPAALFVIVSFAAKAAYFLWRGNNPPVAKNAAAGQ
jgi:hypothetical protein